MRDEVGEAIERRWAEPWPWRGALGLALGLHLGLPAALLLAPRVRSRPIQLPSVQVRIVAAELPAVPAAPARPAATPEVAAKAAPPATAPRPAAPRRAASRPRPAAMQAPPSPAPPALRGGGGAAQAGRAGDEAAQLSSPAGAVGIPGSSGTDETFPYAYYLSGLLAMIETNWYRPTAPPSASCHVRCRIDRAGKLLDAGVEQSSGAPAFDRAALRAIYASSPFPPLPQGFGGSTLTLHLEFGQ
ncbi:MAG: energy transducer TonB [Acidobacteriota bacterium]